jgi:hypothetical protein
VYIFSIVLRQQIALKVDVVPVIELVVDRVFGLHKLAGSSWPLLLYYFDQFGQKLAFLHFRKISENLKNREKIKSGIKKNWCDV